MNFYFTNPIFRYDERKAYLMSMLLRNLARARTAPHHLEIKHRKLFLFGIIWCTEVWKSLV